MRALLEHASRLGKFETLFMKFAYESNVDCQAPSVCVRKRLCFPKHYSVC